MEGENVTGYRLGIKYTCRVLDCRSKGPRFDPRPGHGDFLRVRDTKITHARVYIVVFMNRSQQHFRSKNAWRNFYLAKIYVFSIHMK